MTDTKEDKTSALKAEIAGLVFLALAFLIGLSLVSYHAGASGGWVGLVGNNVSAALFVTIGYGAYVFPVLFSSSRSSFSCASAAALNSGSASR